MDYIYTPDNIKYTVNKMSHQFMIFLSSDELLCCVIAADLNITQSLNKSIHDATTRNKYSNRKYFH